MARIRSSILPALLGLAAVGLLIYGVLQASIYNAPAKPKITQQQIQAKLRNDTAVASKDPAPPEPESQPQKSPPTEALPDTGPGNALAVFAATAALATIGWRHQALRRLG